ncbi:MAG TPA: helix-turn-helix domain-containing protein, partial [Ruminococcus flavefaciens]|nr:helix-turn-helix domain-containing protein [Ruminococcus flavefaciens]
MNNKILTRDEVMKQLRIGRSLFYKLIRRGELEGYKEGNRIKVPADSVDAYI